MLVVLSSQYLAAILPSAHSFVLFFQLFCAALSYCKLIQSLIQLLIVLILIYNKLLQGRWFQTWKKGWFCLGLHYIDQNLCAEILSEDLQYVAWVIWTDFILFLTFLELVSLWSVLLWKISVKILLIVPLLCFMEENNNVDVERYVVGLNNARIVLYMLTVPLI